MIARMLFCPMAVLILTGVLTVAVAQAAPANAGAAPPASGKTVKQQKSHTVKFIKNPNQETAAERERRFKRECKGMPNAGACLGYAN